MSAELAEEWEGIAGEVLAETGCDDPPVDAFELAACCSLEVHPWTRVYGQLDGNVINYPVNARPVRQHGLIAHEVGHWALKRARAKNSESGARYLAGAFMLPRRAFDRDLRTIGWDVGALRAKHINASAEMIARRITQVRDAVATILDNGRVTRRVSSPWLNEPRLGRLSGWESELADAAIASGETVRGDELCYAVPLLDPPFHRVIIVCEAEQLALRLT